MPSRGVYFLGSHTQAARGQSPLACSSATLIIAEPSLPNAPERLSRTVVDGVNKHSGIGSPVGGFYVTEDAAVEM